MTTEPIPDNGRFPDSVNCPLHANALKEIRTIVLETRKEVRDLKDMGGPIAGLRTEVGSLRTSVSAVEEDVREVKNDIVKTKGAITGLIWKVGGIMAPIAAAIAAWIATVMGSNG